MPGNRDGRLQRQSPREKLAVTMGYSLRANWVDLVVVYCMTQRKPNPSRHVLYRKEQLPIVRPKVVEQSDKSVRDASGRMADGTVDLLQNLRPPFVLPQV